MKRPKRKKGMTIDEYAKASGVSRQTIWRAGKLGALVKYADGSINREASDKLRDTHIRGKVDTLQRRVDVAATPPEDEGFSLADLEPEAPDDPDDVAPPVATRADATGAAAYLAARLRNEHIRAERAQLKLDEERGLVIPLEALKAAWFERARAIRDRIRAVPARVAAQVQAADSEHEVVQMLTREIDDAILELTGPDPDNMPRSAKRADVEDEGLTAPTSAKGKEP